MARIGLAIYRTAIWAMLMIIVGQVVKADPDVPRLTPVFVIAVMAGVYLTLELWVSLMAWIAEERK